MNRVLKTFLLWLLVAALHLQGMAAAVKASCGPRHHDMPSMVMMSADHHPEAGAVHHPHDGEHGNAAAPGDGHGDAADSAAHAKPVEKSSYHSSYCSFCAACSVSAAAPPPSSSLISCVRQMEAASASSEASFTGFIPPSLERPPRHFSA